MDSVSTPKLPGDARLLRCALAALSNFLKAKDVPQGKVPIADVPRHRREKCGPLLTSIVEPPVGEAVHAELAFQFAEASL